MLHYFSLLLNLLKRAVRKELCKKVHEKNSSRYVLVPQLDEVVFEGVEKGSMAPRKHPGRSRSGPPIAMDDEMIDVIHKVLKDTSIKILLSDAKKYVSYIARRQPPPSKTELIDKSAVCYWELYNKSKVDFNSLSNEEYKQEEESLKKKADALLASRIFPWKPIEYSLYVGKQHLIERLVPEYAVLNEIFHEIATRCPDFRPHSLFDLGSGLGTASLVARKYWKDSINEYYNVDSSGEMNDLAKLLLNKGDAEAPIPSNVYYRQFLPARSDRRYSITICSYSLLDFASTPTRLQSLWNLWSKTEDYMILVERGKANGFKLILEARDFLLSTEKNSQSSTGSHVFSPCPHDLDCPLSTAKIKSCRFSVPYERLPIGRTRLILNEFYSYVVIRRGERPESDPQWPRVLKAPIKKKHRVVCHLCTKNGKLCSYMFKKRTHGSTYYTFGKSVKAGDRLPISFTKLDINDVKEGDEGLATEITSAEELEGFSDFDSDDETERE